MHLVSGTSTCPIHFESFDYMPTIDRLDQASPVLVLNEVRRHFGAAIKAVDGVSLNVAPGEIVSILGPSGCGKTTTMRMIAGLDRPTSGDILIAGESVLNKPPHRRNVGLVFQSLAIFPHMSVASNVAFGLRMKRATKDTIARKVKATLDVVQLPFAEFGQRMPGQLSGGQLQRVALARTLATEPALVLFDEPMAALDRRLRDHMAIEMRKIQKELGVAGVYVTHDQETASAMSDRIVVMDAGRIVQTGTPQEIYDAPATRFVATFLGDANYLKPEAVSLGADGYALARFSEGTLSVCARETIGDGQGEVFIRPEHVHLHAQRAEGCDLAGRITTITFNAGCFRVTILLDDGQEVLAVTHDQTALAGGVDTRVWLRVDPGHARILAA